MILGDVSLTDDNKIVVEGFSDIKAAAKMVGKELSKKLTGYGHFYSFDRSTISNKGILSMEYDIEWEVGIAAKSVYFRANSSRTNDSVDGTRVIFYIVKEDCKELRRAWCGNKA